MLAVSLAVPAAKLTALEVSYQEASRNTAAEVALQSSRLRSSDESERIDAAVKLAELRSPLAIPALRSALDDKTEMVRAIAVEGLAATGDSQVVQSITARLEQDKSVFVRKAAAYGLGLIGSPGGTSALVGALKDKNEEVRGAASVALGKYRDPSAVDGLVAALNDKSDFIRSRAAFALGVNGRAAIKAVSPLLKLLDSDPAPEVRRQSAIALGEIGDPAALDALERAKRSPDPYLSLAALSAIEKIK
jgi:HEAT repeat protein